MSIEQHVADIGRAPLATLDALARAVWQDFGAGKLTEVEAGTLTEAIEARRRALRRPVQAHSPLRVSVVRESEKRPPATNVVARRSGPRQLTLRIPSPARYDRRASLLHRRRLAASGGLPAQIAQHFTCGEQAVLRVITDEARIHGKCTCTHGELAGRAGVSVSTAKRAIATAIKLGLLHRIERRRPGQKSLANVLTVVRRELRAWIARGPRWREHPPGVQKWTTTDTEGFTKGLRGNVVRATAGAARPSHDRGPDRTHRRDALRA